MAYFDSRAVALGRSFPSHALTFFYLPFRNPHLRKFPRALPKSSNSPIKPHFFASNPLLFPVSPPIPKICAYGAWTVRGQLVPAYLVDGRSQNSRRSRSEIRLCQRPAAAASITRPALEITGIRLRSACCGWCAVHTQPRSVINHTSRLKSQLRFQFPRLYSKNVHTPTHRSSVTSVRSN
jgi:hypothetical protein